MLLVSNAVTLEREKSILYYRLAISGLLASSVLTYNNLHVTGLSSGISLYDGLFNITPFTQGCNLFILNIAFVILIIVPVVNSTVNSLAYLHPQENIKDTNNNKAIRNKQGMSLFVKLKSLLIFTIVVLVIYLTISILVIYMIISFLPKEMFMDLLGHFYKHSVLSLADGELNSNTMYLFKFSTENSRAIGVFVVCMCFLSGLGIFIYNTKLIHSAKKKSIIIILITTLLLVASIRFPFLFLSFDLGLKFLYPFIVVISIIMSVFILNSYKGNTPKLLDYIIPLFIYLTLTSLLYSFAMYSDINIYECTIFFLSIAFGELSDVLVMPSIKFI